MYDDTFDRLFERGRTAVLSGQHYRDTPPVDGGRWGISVILRPPDDSLRTLDTLATEATTAAGGGHWRTGARETAHITVRALEAHRRQVPDNDPAVRRYATALTRAAAGAHSVRLRVGGLTLTPSGVMACMYPTDGAADAFASALADVLGEDAHFEADFTRDIWYATLTHFTGPVRKPAALVGWVAARRWLDLGHLNIREAELVRWTYDGVRPARVPLATAPLLDSRAAVSRATDRRA